MSIIDKIESITTSRNTIRTKMVTAGQATRNDKLATLATNLSITDTSDATATAADIAEGKTAYVEGTKITGTSTKDADTSDATATAGDILSGATAYVNGSKLVGTIQSKSAQTYTPGTTDQTIASGQYLAGTQTIQGSSALTAANIKQGTSIFGVTGTFTSDATATAEDIAEGKTAYVNGSKLVGTASGGGGLDDSYGVTFADSDGINRSHTKIGWIFDNKAFNLPVIIGENVTSCDYMFTDCSLFNRPVNIPNNVLYCSSMFGNCRSFNQIVNFPPNLIKCFRTFNNCQNFNSQVNIPSGECYYTFDNCKNLNSKVIFGNNVTSLTYVFCNCVIFNQPVTIPEGVTTCTGMFSSCNNFNQSVIIPNSVTAYTSMFWYCNNMYSNIYINRTTSGANFYNMLGSMGTSRSNSKRLNVFCNNLSLINGTTGSNAIINGISWTSTTNGYYNTKYNVYILKNYTP